MVRKHLQLSTSLFILIYSKIIRRVIQVVYRVQYAAPSTLSTSWTMAYLTPFRFHLSNFISNIKLFFFLQLIKDFKNFCKTELTWKILLHPIINLLYLRCEPILPSSLKEYLIVQVFYYYFFLKIHNKKMAWNCK